MISKRKFSNSFTGIITCDYGVASYIKNNTDYDVVIYGLSNLRAMYSYEEDIEVSDFILPLDTLRNRDYIEYLKKVKQDYNKNSYDAKFQAVVNNNRYYGDMCFNQDAYKVTRTGYMKYIQWYRPYDEQFRILRDAYLTLNDSFVVEEFTDTTSKIKKLKNSYTPGQVFVYINNVIQWKDVDYEETDGNTITLLKDIVNEDKVRVITIHVNQLRDTDNSLVNYSNIISSLSTTIDTLTRRVQQLESEVSELKSKSE